RGGLDEDADLGGEHLLCVEDLLIADRVDEAARVVARLDREVPGGGGTDPDGGRDRLGVRDRVTGHGGRGAGGLETPHPRQRVGDARLDRKSTRLNSSHVSISYAVFCLKKKTKTTN